MTAADVNPIVTAWADRGKLAERLADDGPATLVSEYLATTWPRCLEVRP